MYQKIRNQSEGFTIIEVLIVLAIAGLIMLIVFLAVPALQRNSRNNGRNSDASRIAAAVNECVSNRNGQIAQCQALGGNNVNIDTTKLNQLATAPAHANNAGSTTQAFWFFNAACSADGLTVVTPAPSTRQFVVRFQAETSSGSTNRCIDS